MKHCQEECVQNSPCLLDIAPPQGRSTPWPKSLPVCRNMCVHALSSGPQILATLFLQDRKWLPPTIYRVVSQERMWPGYWPFFILTAAKPNNVFIYLTRVGVVYFSK